MIPQIYNRYLSRQSSFEMTLQLIQEILNCQLSSNYNRIIVQGNNSGKAKLCFTIFNRDGYTMKFVEMNNIRKFSSESDITHIESVLNSLRRGVLSDFLI